VFVDGFNRNLNVRLNQMVALARGRYFVRMDADDIMHPERLERQLAVLRREGDNTVVGSAAWSIDHQSRVIGIRPAPRARGLKGFAARHSLLHPTVAGAVQWFRDNPYSESFIFHRSQDAELWCRTSSGTRFVVMPEPLLFYREMDEEFSLPNYLGTSLGVLYLAAVYSGSRVRACLTLCLELAKVWVTCAAVIFGKERWLVERRFRKVAEPERQRAERILSFVPGKTPDSDGTVAPRQPLQCPAVGAEVARE
jgi:glycosyltransferase involved in cell wall biosynthesis